MNIVYSDFDGSIRSYTGKPIYYTINKLKAHLKAGDRVSVITRRSYFDNHNELDGEGVKKWVKDNIGDIPVIFTGGLFKFRFLLNNKADLLYEDDYSEIKALQGTDIKVEWVQEDTSELRLNSINQDVPETFTKSILVYDTGGVYVHTAERLSYEYKDVYYFSSFKSDAFPESYKKNLGQGIKGVTRVNDVEQAKDKCDVIFFPDCALGATMEDFKAKGYRVFGGGKTCELETNRGLFKEWLEKNNLPVIPYKRVIGIDNVMYELSKLDLSKDDRYIKISSERGDFETYNANNNFNTTNFLTHKKLEMGWNGKHREYIIEEPLEGIENGIDTYCVGVQMPNYISTGLELKDCGYIQKMIDRSELPVGMKAINNALSKTFEENDNCSFVCTENRYNGKDFYFNDGTIRCGIPPSECQFSNWLNYGNIIWMGSEGICIEPIFKKVWAAQVIIKSDESTSRELEITCNQDFKTQIHFYNYNCEGDNYYTVPLNIDGHNVVCSAVGLGDTMEEAIINCMTVASCVKTDGVEYAKHAFSEIGEYIEKSEAMGLSLL